MLILGIETSCDDTCASIVKATGGFKRPRFTVLSNIRSSQVHIHQEFGGVVPNLAARAHLENMNPVLTLAFKKAGIRMKDAKSKIDLIAVTSHPGLIPCLLIGTNVARTLAWLWDKPIIGVNHLDGHVYANWPVHIKQKRGNKKLKTYRIRFPTMCLIVSGGHTQLVLMKGYGKFRIIGETLDDAAGEAFDKVAKLLGLSFPGGPPIAREAEKMAGEKLQEIFPRPMIHSGNYQFSFSGLKTAVLYLVKEKYMKKGRVHVSTHERALLSAEFEQAVVDVLVAKTLDAAKRYGVKTVILGGGVGANKKLRRELGKRIRTELPNVTYLIPPVDLAVDNAAMIAFAGYFHYLKKGAKSWKDIKARAVL